MPSPLFPGGTLDMRLNTSLAGTAIKSALLPVVVSRRLSRHPPRHPHLATSLPLPSPPPPRPVPLTETAAVPATTLSAAPSKAWTLFVRFSKLRSTTGHKVWPERFKRPKRSPHSPPKLPPIHQIRRPHQLWSACSLKHWVQHMLSLVNSWLVSLEIPDVYCCATCCYTRTYYIFSCVVPPSPHPRSLTTTGFFTDAFPCRIRFGISEMSRRDALC